VFLLDTDYIVLLEEAPSELNHRIISRMAAHDPNQFFVSIVSFHEQFGGWQSLVNRNRDSASIVRAYHEFAKLLTAYSQAPIVHFDAAASTRFELLRKQRIRVGTMDLRIAAIALVNDYTVLTRNLVDFEKVPDLKVEDWTIASTERPR
jgi:tRNA(fMet)-specific endonuclease VapC